MIEIVKKSMERFLYTVDFGPALPEGVRVAKASGAPACEVVEDGRAVRFMVEKDGALSLIVTLSDGQVVAQDVVVKVDDAVAKYDPDQPRDEDGKFGEGGGGAGGGAGGGGFPASSIKRISRTDMDRAKSRLRGEADNAMRLLDEAEVHAEKNRYIDSKTGKPVDVRDDDRLQSVLRMQGKVANAADRARSATTPKEFASRVDEIEEASNWVVGFLSHVEKSARTYTGNFTQPTNATHADAYAVRAYGSGPDDKRIWRAATAGLPVATCPDCDTGAAGERREVAVKELALSRNALSRGKLSRMASALRDGVREGEDVAAIKVAELHAGDGDGPRYAVLPGEGNHRVAHLMLSRKAGNVPVMVVPAKAKTSKATTTEKAATLKRLVPVDMAGRRAHVRERVQAHRLKNKR